jgi:hypothetical protein
MIPLGWMALAGLNAALGVSKAAQQAKQRRMEAAIRAAEIEAAPWTNKAPSTQVTTSAPNIWAEMAGAGVNTLGQGAALQGAGLFSESADALQAPGVGAEMGPSATSTLMPTTKQAMTENSSFLNPWESKRNIWMSAFNPMSNK